MREEIRAKLDDVILYLYHVIRRPLYPIDPYTIVRRVDQCRYITYDKLAVVSGSSYEDVVKACHSLDGSTMYDPSTGRYLVAINTSKRRAAPRTRIRWTTAHELGHIAAGHFLELAERPDGGSRPSDFQDMEEEADYFAASFLAPIPAIKWMRAKRPADIRDWFGLSQTAAEYRWTDVQNGVCDPRLEDHFQVFHPKSLVQEARRMSTKAIDITVDPRYLDII